MASSNDSVSSVEPAISTQTDRILVTFIIFTISMTGLLSNLSVFLFATTLKSLRNSFGQLSASQSFAEAILCGVFVFFYCPMVLLDISLFKVASAHAGLVLLFCYDVCIFSHLFIALNRLCAISRPIEYSLIFDEQNTRILIFIAYLIPCFTSIYMHLANHCLLPYVDFGWYFGVNTSAECDVIRFYVDFCKDFGVVALIGIVDVMTIIMIRVTAPGFTRISTLRSSQSERKRKREITFVKQALIQGAVFATELVFFFIISTMQTHPVMIFLCTTVAWTLVHTLDPIVLICLNSEFRNMLRNPFGHKSARINVSTLPPETSSSHQN